MSNTSHYRVQSDLGRFHSFIRGLALQQRNHPGRLFLSVAGRLYYAAALLALRVWASSHRYVEAVLLCGSGARGNLRYGVSDLDIVVIIKDCDNASIFVARCCAELKLLATIFPMISVGPHEIVFKRSAFEQSVLVQRPFLLSVSDFSKFLYVRGSEVAISIPYRIEHELCTLNFLWDKLLIVTRAEPGSRYFRYLCDRLMQQFEALEDRLELPRRRFPDRNVTSTDLIVWHQELTDSVYQRLSIFRPQTVPDLSAELSAFEIPNRLFFESPFHSVQHDRVSLRLLIPSSGMSARLQAERLIRSLAERCDADYFLLDGVLLPLRGKLDILHQHTHRLTFHEVAGITEELSSVRSGVEEDLRACVGAVQDAPVSLKKVNREYIRGIRDDRNGVFALKCKDPGFLAKVFAVWKCEENGQVSECDIEAVRTIEETVKRERLYEAQFQLRSYLVHGEVRIANLQTSVLIITRNRSSYLRKALASLGRQTMMPSEIIVVDNDSTDDTPQVVAENVEQLPMLRYVKETRPGIPCARNRALRESSSDSDVVAFLDDDCVAAPDWLYLLTLPFSYDESIVSTGGFVEFSSEDATIWGEFYINQRSGEST